ncbi:MAG TPA: c-type cytochrome [Sulfuricaulis sp.]
MKLAVITITSFAALLIVGQASAGADADGKAVFDKSCAGCHKVMSPKMTGEKAKWEPLLKQGNAALTASVIKGKGAMPPKGGAKSDAEVKAAVDYMVTQIK